MKHILVTLLAVVTLASCSTPKYSYFFDNHDYEAGKRKKQAQTQEVTRVTPEEIMQIIQDVPPAEEDVAIASTGKQIIPSKAEGKAERNVTSPTISKEKKRELGKQLKTAIKDYKKQSRDGSLAEGGDKNQLVALILAIFLGALGIHRFYIGRTGTALLQLLLFILGLFLIIPLYALAVWVLIDIILIAMGNLTPKNGSYNPKL
ncbi:MAG TPA: TM2 domain-containing protein [Cyclobacteriaceae bacterium]|nr:TM2 domain-containing protein [Cyclobacteriaceae bacterium]